MERIIGGRFATKAEADVAARRIFAYKDESDVCIFHNNAPGQHAQYPLGGDEDNDPSVGDEGADKSAATTAVVAGAVAGAVAAAAGPVAALAAAGVAAYTGSLVGAFNASNAATAAPHPHMRRPAGIILAVHVATVDEETRVIDDLKGAGAMDVEEAEGEWRDGDWVDFDPLATPKLVH